MSDYTYRRIITDRGGVANGEKIVNVPDEVVKQIRADAINDYYNTLNKKINTDTRLKETIREIHDNVAKEMYCKGVDDLTERLKDYFVIPHDIRVIEMIAEQLKEQNK